MGTKQPDVTKLVRHIHNGLKRYGFTALDGEIKHIVEAKPQSLTKATQRRVFIEITAIYSISEKKMRSSNARGLVTEAKVMAIILLHRHCNHSTADLSRMFSRGTNLVQQRLKNFKRAIEGGHGEKIYGEKPFLDNYRIIHSRINKWKKTH